MNRQFIKLKKDNFFKRVWSGRKNYSFHKTYGASAPTATYPIYLTEVLNQGDTQMCTAFTAVAIRKSMTGKTYDPYRQWDAEIAIWGKNPSAGVDLETQMATGVKTGFFVTTQPMPIDAAKAWFTVTAKWGQDTFDATKNALIQGRAPLSVGLQWQDDWDFAPQGVVPHTWKKELGGHDTKIAGVKTINGIDYLVIQNSWGVTFGDQGIFYFDRFMANKFFAQIKYWTDQDVPDIQRLGLLNSLLVQLKNLLTSLVIWGAKSITK